MAPCSRAGRLIAPPRRQTSAEPPNPSQVFLGLIAGAIRWRPTVMPAK